MRNWIKRKYWIAMSWLWGKLMPQSFVDLFDLEGKHLCRVYAYGQIYLEAPGEKKEQNYELQELRIRLSKALGAEDYDLAAQLRDEIANKLNVNK